MADFRFHPGLGLLLLFLESLSVLFFFLDYLRQSLIDRCQHCTAVVVGFLTIDVRLECTVLLVLLSCQSSPLVCVFELGQTLLV